MQTNAILLEKISSGDIGAFNTLYNNYWDRLFSFAYKISNGDRELSQQIVQDIFIYVWEKKETLKIDNLESYLFQATKFQVYNYYNRNKLNTVYLEDTFEIYLTEVSFTEDHPVYELLYGAIEKLPEKRKNILLLNKIQGLDINQIAQQLDLSPQTVKNQLGSALKQLRLELKDVSMVIALIELYETFK